MLPPAPSHPQRLVYLGTPELAVLPLRALHAAGFEIALVVSRADKRRRRSSGPEPSPVKAAALELGLPVTDQLEVAGQVGADLGVVVAYGRLIPVSLLERVPMINLHFSLLPRWRGAAPVERAILAGDETTGVCLMRVEEGLDTGGVYARRELSIGPDETAAELRERLVAAGVELLLATLERGLGEPQPQVGEPTYAEKVTPNELRLDWERPALELHRKVRVGGAYTFFRGKRLKIWRSRLVDPGSALQIEQLPSEPPRPGELLGTMVATGDGMLELLEVQPEGRPRIDAQSWRHGARPQPGERLGHGA
ncbi:MAG: methionyl-tRNA formyltransferase [Acidimicrobiales bacterium]